MKTENASAHWDFRSLSTACLLTYLHNGADLPRMFVHGSTAVFMAITSLLLFKGDKKATA